ncbi:MAG: PIN domain-containing protein [Spirochaeta sp.]|jgi:predicted nucleic acid-binding protein|nr:PIN domain-containing protein [Spirochaeta sp.]
MSVDFIDSNVFVYLFDTEDHKRNEIARTIVEDAIRAGSGVISHQVVQEVLNVTTHKMEHPLTGEDALGLLDTVLFPLWRVYPSQELYRRTLEIKTRYRFGLYDSLIVAAALESGCFRLLTEDLQNGQTIGALTIVNPFADTTAR